VLVLHAVSHTFEQMFACAQLIAEGVLDRHPGLRVVFLEAGGGWAPYWLARLDHQVASYGGYAPRMQLTPSEYFARQCWVSFEIDEVTLPALAPFVGVDRIVWGSDYPHADSTFPGALDELRATIAPLPVEQQTRILSANATALYAL
jgi:predicted TIM-barrel fold metal-dependent hydrolase